MAEENIARVNPRVDIAFKKIFGVEENKDLLISLINSIVSEEDRVKEVTLLNPYNPENFRGDKCSILDVKAKGERGKLFDIEIQLMDEGDYDKRALYYWSKLYTEQLESGWNYATLNKTIGIHLLSFLFLPFPDREKYHNVFHIVEKDSGEPFFSDLELHTIELSKFTNDPKEGLPQLLKKVKTSLDVWSAFLTRHDLFNKNRLPKEMDNPSLKKALTVIEVMNFTKEEREIYEAHLKWMRAEESTLKKAEAKAKEKGIEIGIDIGREEGIEIGREEGMEIGVEKGIGIGREEEKIAMAKNLRELGIAIDIICKTTGLTKEQIKNLKIK